MTRRNSRKLKRGGAAPKNTNIISEGFVMLKIRIFEMMKGYSQDEKEALAKIAESLRKKAYTNDEVVAFFKDQLNRIISEKIKKEDRVPTIKSAANAMPDKNDDDGLNTNTTNYGKPSLIGPHGKVSNLGIGLTNKQILNIETRKNQKKWPKNKNVPGSSSSEEKNSLESGVKPKEVNSNEEWDAARNGPKPNYLENDGEYHAPGRGSETQENNNALKKPLGDAGDVEEEERFLHPPGNNKRYLDNDGKYNPPGRGSELGETNNNALKKPLGDAGDVEEEERLLHPPGNDKRYLENDGEYNPPGRGSELGETNNNAFKKPLGDAGDVEEEERLLHPPGNNKRYLDNDGEYQAPLPGSETPIKEKNNKNFGPPLGNAGDVNNEKRNLQRWKKVHAERAAASPDGNVEQPFGIIGNLNEEPEKQGMEEGTDCEIDPIDFATQHNIGRNFLSLYGTYCMDNDEKTEIVHNPVGFLLNLSDSKLHTKAEGALYLLLTEFAKQFNDILTSGKYTDDDSKLIQIIALRELIVRVIIHSTANFALACNDNKANDMILKNKFNGTLSADAVKTHYFPEAKDTCEVLKTNIWSLFTEDTVNAFVSKFGIKKIELEVLENRAYSSVLEGFLLQEQTILSKDMSSELFTIFTSSRTEAVLELLKDPIKGLAKDASEILWLDILYSTSIAPVRFTRLGELVEYINNKFNSGTVAPPVDPLSEESSTDDSSANVHNIPPPFTQKNINKVEKFYEGNNKI